MSDPSEPAVGTTPSADLETQIWTKWQELLADDPEEPRVQKFLEENPALLPGARGDIGPGGNHGPIYGAVFRQPPLSGLSVDRRPDFMWITKSTVMVTPICIEIEKPGKRWFTQEGHPTADFVEAQNQLMQWKTWFGIPINEMMFRDKYLKNRFSDLELEAQFVLIYGRESEFVRSDVRLPTRDRHNQRLTRAHDRETLLTFDSLQYDARLGSMVTVTMHSNDTFTVSSVPETFSGLTDPRGAYYLGSIEDALDTASWATPDRTKAVLADWEAERIGGQRLVEGKTYRPLPGLVD